MTVEGQTCGQLGTEHSCFVCGLKNRTTLSAPRSKTSRRAKRESSSILVNSVSGFAEKWLLLNGNRWIPATTPCLASPKPTDGPTYPLSSWSSGWSRLAYPMLVFDLAVVATSRQLGTTEDDRQRPVVSPQPLPNVRPQICIELRDRDGRVIPVISTANNASVNAGEIVGCNIAVPHGGGGRRNQPVGFGGVRCCMSVVLPNRLSVMAQKRRESLAIAWAAYSARYSA